MGDKKLIIFKHGSFVYVYLSDDKSFYYLASFKITNIKYKENYGMKSSREFTERSHQIERMVSLIEISKVYECVFLFHFQYVCSKNLASPCPNLFFCKMWIISRLYGCSGLNNLIYVKYLE